MSTKQFQSFVVGIIFCTTLGTAYAQQDYGGEISKPSSFGYEGNTTNIYDWKDEYENKKINDPFFSDCQQILYLINVINKASQIIVPVFPHQEKEILLTMTVLGHGYLFYCSTIEYQNTTDMIGLHQQFLRYYYELSLISDEFEWNESKYGNPQHFTFEVND